MIVPLVIGTTLLAAGVFCIVKPHYVITWLRSLARPIGRNLSATSRRVEMQAQQATSRPLFVRIFGLIFSGIGLWVLIGTVLANMHRT